MTAVARESTGGTQYLSSYNIPNKAYISGVTRGGYIDNHRHWPTRSLTADNLISDVKSHIA